MIQFYKSLKTEYIVVCSTINMLIYKNYFINTVVHRIPTEAFKGHCVSILKDKQNAWVKVEN